MMERTRKDDVRPVKCAGCHLPAHAYGTADPNNDYDANACVKGLLAENERLRLEREDLRAAVRFLVGVADMRRDTIDQWWSNDWTCEVDVPEHLLPLLSALVPAGRTF